MLFVKVMPDIKLGTSTFNDINVLEVYDLNNNLVRFIYEGLVNNPKIGVSVVKYNKDNSLSINPNNKINISISKEDN